MVASRRLRVWLTGSLGGRGRQPQLEFPPKMGIVFFEELQGFC